MKVDDLFQQKGDLMTVLGTTVFKATPGHGKYAIGYKGDSKRSRYAPKKLTMHAGKRHNLLIHHEAHKCLMF